MQPAIARLLWSVQIAALVLAVVAVPGVWAAQGTEAGRLAAPGNLKCEYRVTPLGMDVLQPRLSWQVQDSRRGAKQAAYQILVSTDQGFAKPQAAIWDSGKVDSDQSVQVVYAGKPLTSSTRYYWKVRTWDAGGKTSEYSAAAWFETGLLQPADWKAKWITAPMPGSKSEPTLEGANWIWNAKAEGNNKEAWFRRSLQLESAQAIEKARNGSFNLCLMDLCRSEITPMPSMAACASMTGPSPPLLASLPPARRRRARTAPIASVGAW